MRVAPLNILVLHAHDMGCYNAIYGHPAPTPHMLELARSGVVFRHAHCAAPTCSPSRAAMWTGQTAHQAGMLGLVHRGFDLREPRQHLASYFRQHGYETVLCGQQHELRPEKMAQVYDMAHLCDTLGNPERDQRAADCAIEYLSLPKRSPWFLSVGFFLPHRAFLPADPTLVDENFVLPPAPLPDTRRVRRDMAEYYTSVAATDRQIGRILRALDGHGLRKNTLIVLTTDHGIAFPHMKCRLTSHGTNVTLVLSHPQIAPPSPASDALVSHVDLVPTLCEAAGLPLPPWTIGKSLLPILASRAEQVREDLFAEVNFHAAAEPMRSVRTARFNYIRIFDEDLRLPLANVDESYAKDELLAAGWPDLPRQKVQLFDLTLDPTEARNVADDPRYADIVLEMEMRLRHWLAATDDPLLHGPLAQPSGTMLNGREAPSTSHGPYLHAH